MWKKEVRKNYANIVGKIVLEMNKFCSMIKTDRKHLIQAYRAQFNRN
jgi:hypothetical protein